MSDYFGQLLPFGWADSAQAPALTPSSATLWDVIDKGIAGYLTVKSAENAADSQRRLIEAQTKQAMLLGTVPQMYNPNAQLTPIGAWSGWQGGGGSPLGGAAGSSIGSLLLIAGLVLGAVYLVR